MYFCQIVAQALRQPSRGVFHAAHQDVCRGLAEWQYTLHHKIGRLTHLVFPPVAQAGHEVRKSIGIPIGRPLGLPDGIGPRRVHSRSIRSPIRQSLCGDAVCLQIPCQRPRIGRPGKPGVLHVHRCAVGLSHGFQRKRPEDRPVPVDLPHGALAVLPAAKQLLLHVCKVCKGRLDQRPVFRAGRVQRRLGALDPVGGEIVHARFKRSADCIFDHAHRSKGGVAHDVAHVGARVSQHGQIAPCVPLVHPGGGHLPGDVPVDLLHGRVPPGLILRLQELIHKRLVDVQVRGLVPIALRQLPAQVLHAALDAIKLALRGKLFQHSLRLHGLRRLRRKGCVVGQDVDHRPAVPSVHCVVQQQLATGHRVLSCLPARRLLVEGLPRSVPSLALYGLARPFLGRLIRDAVKRKLAVGDGLFNDLHRAVRRRPGLQDGGCGLGDAPPLEVLHRNVHRAGRLLALRVEALRLVLQTVVIPGKSRIRGPYAVIKGLPTGILGILGIALCGCICYNGGRRSWACLVCSGVIDAVAAVGKPGFGRPGPSGRRIYSVDTVGGRVSFFLYLGNVMEHAPSVGDLCLYHPGVFACFRLEHYIEIVPPSGRLRMVTVINGIQQEYCRFKRTVQIGPGCHFCSL